MGIITAFGVEIPPEAMSLAGYREWFASLGEGGPRACFNASDLHLEMNAQSYETHAPLVDAIGDTLVALAAAAGLGRYYRPPSWFTDEAAELSAEPDGFLLRYASIRSGRVRINPDRRSEMLGAPDWALEVVSATSIKKDTVDLVAGYARGRVSEYWIANALGEEVSLRILVLGDDGYEEVPQDDDGWTSSTVWKRSFRLRRGTDEVGWPTYALEVKPPLG